MIYKYKVEIVIDEEKIIKDDIYEPNEMYEFIRNMFRRFDLPEIKTDKPCHLIFTDKDRNRDYGALWRVILDLYDMEWFKKYNEKYLWYNEPNNSIEDIMSGLNKCRKK